MAGAKGSANAEATTDPVDRVFRALASRPRRRILAMLAAGAKGDSRCCASDEICACDFAEGLALSAPTVSHHMRVLVDAGLVDSRKEGLWVFYRLRPETVALVMSEFSELLRGAGCCGPDEL
ncbi:MAG: helix-turn-helix transcriptional regulator [Coriobacteriales bacterium]|nr:helix-turn-helix transcriptional regulator [Coriobacteriales bacterium]